MPPGPALLQEVRGLRAVARQLRRGGVQRRREGGRGGGRGVGPQLASYLCQGGIPDLPASLSGPLLQLHQLAPAVCVQERARRARARTSVPAARGVGEGEEGGHAAGPKQAVPGARGEEGGVEHAHDGVEDGPFVAQEGHLAHRLHRRLGHGRRAGLREEEVVEAQGGAEAIHQAGVGEQGAAVRATGHQVVEAEGAQEAERAVRAGGHVRQGRQRGELRGHLAVRGPAHERRGQREVRAPQPDGPLGQEDGDRERSQQDRREAQGVRAQGLPARAAGRLPGRPEAPLKAQRGAHVPRVERPRPAEAQRAPAHAPAQGREARLVRLVVEVLIAQEARAGRGERPRGPVGVALEGGERREGGSLALDLVHQGPDVVPAGDLH